MSKLPVIIVASLVFGFLFTLLFGGLGLGYTTIFRDRTFPSQTSAAENNDCVYFSATTEIYVGVGVASKEPTRLLGQYYEPILVTGQNYAVVQPHQEYCLDGGPATITVYGGATVYNAREQFRYKDANSLIINVFVITGALIGIIFGIIIANEPETPKQHFIGE